MFRHTPRCSNDSVFVSARPVPTVNSTIPTIGAACQYDQFMRPIAGQLNFNPKTFNISAKGSSQYQQLFQYTLREVIHILGFSGTLFGSFRDPNDYSTALPLASVLNVITTPKTPTTTVYTVITPQVVATAIDHYSCQTITSKSITSYLTHSRRGS